MYNKDLNILGLKVDSLNNKKDISFVTDINSYVQKIENVCRLQKGEIPSSVNLGTDYYSFIFDPVSNKSSTEDNIAVSIVSGIRDIKKAIVDIIYFDDTKVIMNVTFTLRSWAENRTATCKIEVELV